MRTSVRSAGRPGRFATVSAPAPDDLLARKARGAFFTSPAIAHILTDWAIARNAEARILDPTCGDGVFLLAAGERLRALGAPTDAIREQLSGTDVHAPSLAQARAYLSEDELDATLIHADFFNLRTPAQLGAQVGWQDAVVGNPPFVRYQEYGVPARKRAAAAALAQGVRLNGLASSWAPLLVHAAGYLKPEGRLAMVVPAELLTVSYAEPIRRWLRRRFRSVSLVLFDELQFDAEEQVVLLVAQGTGSCDAFTLYEVRDADQLAERHIFDASSAALREDGKWTDLILPTQARQLFRQVATDRFSRLDIYGTPELGTVTGANDYFCISDVTRAKWKLDARLLKPISPPGTKHLKGFSFTRAQWEELKLAGERVWLLHPDANSKATALQAYVAHGKKLKIDQAYKCTVRTPWWRPPAVPAPDLFFTYMSHRYPRLIANVSDATILNSMHGIRLKREIPKLVRDALPLLALNSVTMLGAEVLGRSYGGGILKMEPREAAGLPVPGLNDIRGAWLVLGEQRAALEAELKHGGWSAVLDRVDEVLLCDVMQLPAGSVSQIREAASLLRIRRTRQTEPRAANT